MAEAKEKAVNYTPEMTAEMKSAYAAGETVEAIAAKLGKTVKSVTAKLVREGVYKKKEYVTKTGEKPVKKDDMADGIGRILKLTEAETESLTKCSKTALAKIALALANSKPLEE